MIDGNYDIFISYSRADFAKVKAIKAEVERSTNARCWMDLEDIESGAPQFPKHIVEGIEQTTVFLFMLSAKSQASRFALKELHYASEEVNTHVVIVNIDGCSLEKEFKLLFGLTDIIFWERLPQREKLFRDIKRWTGNNENWIFNWDKIDKWNPLQPFKMELQVAAGTNVGLVARQNNDNFVVSPDLSTSTWIIPQSDDFVEMGASGALLAVADGEGWKGDVASAIAVKTIQELFAAEYIEGIAGNQKLMESYMKDAFAKANSNVSNYKRANPSTAGMSAAMTAAWIVGDKAIVCSYGNCRCYVFHTYGKKLRLVTTEMSMNAPMVQTVSLTHGDIVLLCTDGLYNMCSYDYLTKIITINGSDFKNLKDELLCGALNMGGKDNVTVALCKFKIN